MGFGIVMPVLPFLVKDMGASGTVLGLVMAAYAAAQFVCAPLWGRLSDRVGRRPVMLGTIAGTGLSLLLLGLAPSLLWVFVARLAGGAFAANVSVASAYVADVTDESERTRWMGMIGASFAVGFVLGPAIGGLLGGFGYGVPMLAAAALSVVNLVVAAVALREPERRAEAATGARAARVALLQNPVVRRLCVANLAFAAAVTQLETLFAFFMADRFGYDVLGVAVLLIAMAVVMGGIQGGGMKALSRRYSERSLAVVGTLLLAAGFLGMVPAPSVALLVAPLLLLAVGRAIAQPAMMSLASAAASPADRGSVMGTFQSAASLARVFGPALAGLLYDVSLAAPFVLASALVLAVSFAARGFPERSADAALAAPPVPGL